MSRNARTPLFVLAGLAAIALFAVQIRGLFGAEGTGGPSAVADRGGELATPSAERVVAEGRVTTYPGAEILVSSEVAGAIVTLAVTEKQRVRRGQLIAELRSDDLRAQLAEAAARIVESEAEIRLAEAERDRAQSLYEQKVDTASRRDKAVRDLEVAAARRTTAKAAATRLEAEIAKRRIVAPIDGVVLVRHVDAGESIEARAGIVTIADLARVRIEAEVDEFDTGKLRPGSAVAIAAEGFDGERWRGTVEEIPDSVQGRRLKPQDPGKPA
ncbi:MAG: efflux RND transporter periplasmic adaptor subunit, partial [Thermoanaerobaculia bacterium]|nr:efflux RND transporter periplasmic adaptor subunit [Thermoanaerobaculia bacterium]